MATSSFNKDFTLNSKKTVKSFEKIISTPSKSVKIKKDLISPENEKRGEHTLKKFCFVKKINFSKQTFVLVKFEKV